MAKEKKTLLLATLEAPLSSPTAPPPFSSSKTPEPKNIISVSISTSSTAISTTTGLKIYKSEGKEEKVSSTSQTRKPTSAEALLKEFIEANPSPPESVVPVEANPTRATAICFWQPDYTYKSESYRLSVEMREKAEEAQARAMEKDSFEPPDEQRLAYLEGGDRYFHFIMTLDYVSAVEMYNAATAMKSRRALPYFRSAVVLTKADFIFEALEFYKTALLISPRFLVVLYYQGNLLFKLGKYDEAEKAYHAALEELKYRLGSKGDSMTWLFDYEPNGAPRETILWKEFRSNIQDTFDQEAWRFGDGLKKAKRLNCKMVVHQYFLTLAKLKKHKEAVRSLLSYHEQYYHNLPIDIQYQAGFSFSALGDFERAYYSFSSAAHRDDNCKKNLIAIARRNEFSLAPDNACFTVHLATHQNSRYKAICDALDQHNVSYEDTALLSAWAYLAVNPTIKALLEISSFFQNKIIHPAVIFLRVTLRIDPRCISAYEDLIHLFHRQLNQPGEAFETCQALLTIDSTNRYARSVYSDLRAEVAKYQYKLSECETALTTLPKDAAIRKRHGDLLVQLGRQPEAIQAYLAALALDRSVPEAKEAFRKLTGYDYDLEAKIATVVKKLQIFRRPPEDQATTKKAGFFALPKKGSDLNRNNQLANNEIKGPGIFQPVPQKQVAGKKADSFQPLKKAHNKQSKQSENDQLTNIVLSYTNGLTMSLPEESSKCVIQ